jgi:hypothetical protein
MQKEIKNKQWEKRQHEGLSMTADYKFIEIVLLLIRIFCTGKLVFNYP